MIIHLLFNDSLCNEGMGSDEGFSPTLNPLTIETTEGNQACPLCVDAVYVMATGDEPVTLDADDRACIMCGGQATHTFMAHVSGVIAQQNVDIDDDVFVCGRHTDMVEGIQFAIQDPAYLAQWLDNYGLSQQESK